MLYLFGAKIRLFLVTSKDLGENVGMMMMKNEGFNIKSPSEIAFQK